MRVSNARGGVTPSESVIPAMPHMLPAPPRLLRGARPAHTGVRPDALARRGAVLAVGFAGPVAAAAEQGIVEGLGGIEHGALAESLREPRPAGAAHPLRAQRVGEQLQQR